MRGDVHGVCDGLGAADGQGRGTRWVDFAEVLEAGTEGGYAGGTGPGDACPATERNAPTPVAGPGGIAASTGDATKEAIVLVDNLAAVDFAELFDTLLLGH